MLDLTAQLAAQLIGYHVGPQPVERYAEKPTNIVFASNGIFRVVKTPIALFKTKIGDTTSKEQILGVEAMTAGPELLIPKIPFRYLQMILSWYRDVNTQDRTEASVLFFWNYNNVALPVEYADGKAIDGLLVDGQLVLYCPKQRNSGGLSEFHMDTMVPWLRENLALLCETHSHNTMGAFFSGTDDANENATQFYGVWGKVTDNEPAFAFRYVCGDQKIQIAPDALFEWPKRTIRTIEVTEIEGQEPVEVLKEEKVELLKGPFPQIDYPEDWMPQHTKAVVITPSYGGTSRYPYSQAARNAGAIDTGGKEYQAPLHSYDGYPYEEDEDFYARYRKAEHERSAHGGHAAAGGKKLEENLREVGNGSLGGADVAEIHTAQDFANLRVVENEAKDIAEDLRDYGFTEIIESAIDATKENGLNQKKVN